MTEPENQSSREAVPRTLEASSRQKRRYTVRVGKLLGVELRVHKAFLVLLLGVALQSAFTGGWANFARVLDLVAALAAHEFGHALVARRLGYGTSSVNLQPFFIQPGVPTIFTRREDAIRIALAGPAINLALAFVAWVTLSATGHTIASASAIFADHANAIERFLQLNTVIATVNLLPAFPWDSGRALKAGLAIRCGEMRASAVVSLVSLGIALLLTIVAGVSRIPVIGALALITALATIFEWSMALPTAAAACQATVADAALSDPTTIPPDTRVKDALALCTVTQPILAVVLGQETLGTVSRAALVYAMRRGDSHQYVSGLMARHVTFAAPTTRLSSLLSGRIPPIDGAVVVTESGNNGLPIGLLTHVAVWDFLINRTDSGERAGPS